jgi:hypothetical protein
MKRRKEGKKKNGNEKLEKKCMTVRLLEELISNLYIPISYLLFLHKQGSLLINCVTLNIQLI